MKPAVEEDLGWLQLLYRLPSEPSRQRVFVWRRVRSLGALSVRVGVCIAPDLPEVREALSTLAAEISGWGSWAELFEVRLSQEQRRTYVAALNARREDEYGELLTDCRRLAERVERHLANREFAFEEVEELSEEMEKLNRWRDKIARRDFFGCSRVREVEDALGLCSTTLERFEHAVAHESVAAEEEK